MAARVRRKSSVRATALRVIGLSPAYGDAAAHKSERVRNSGPESGQLNDHDDLLSKVHAWI